MTRMKLSKILKVFIPTFLVVLAGILFFYSRTLIGVSLPDKILRPMGHSFGFMSFLSNKPNAKKIIYAYLPYWYLEQSEYVQLDRLTDISYFGVYMEADGNFKTILDDGTAEPGYRNWRENKKLDEFLKKARNSGIRVSLTVISHDDEISDKFLSCRDCWDTFLTNVTKEMDSKRITDLNLNFEYVELTDKETALKYSEFTKFVNENLDKKYGESTVVVASFADSMVKDRVSDIESLAKVADFIFIMAYDFHRPNSDKAGPVSPIDGIGVYAEYDIRTMINDYLKVAPAEKLILGVPYYGYNWVVKNPEPNSERLPGDDDIGYSQSQTYAQIMDTVLKLKPEVKWDDLGKVPFFTYVSPETGSTREVYFENEQSLTYKYQLVKDHDFGGVGIWALGYDGGYVELWNLLYKEFF